MLQAYNAYQAGVSTAQGGGSFGSGYSNYFGLSPSGTFWQFIGFDGNVRFSGIGANIVAKADDNPYAASMRAAPPEDTSWYRLLFEFGSGTGPRSRQFGSNSAMTQGLKTSPDVATFREQFCALPTPMALRQLGPTGSRFGLRAEDGPITAGTNMPRQFVGSFTITIRGSSNGSALFILNNTTSLESLLYHLPVENKKSGVMGNTQQTFWWKESCPCGCIGPQ